MNANITGILLGAAMVTSIVIVTRWLLAAEQAEAPKTEKGSRIYGVRNRLKIAGFGIVSIFIVFLVSFRHEDPRSLWLLTIPICFILLGIWLATGSVVTNAQGITKRTFWSSRAIRWEEISGVRYFGRQKYIEVYTPKQKMSIDRRFVAHAGLLDEILRQTKVQLERK
jgi:hypothetical protein